MRNKLCSRKEKYIYYLVDELSSALETKFPDSSTSKGAIPNRLSVEKHDYYSIPILASAHEDGYIYLWSITVSPFMELDQSSEVAKKSFSYVFIQTEDVSTSSIFSCFSIVPQTHKIIHFFLCHWWFIWP